MQSERQMRGIECIKNNNKNTGSVGEKIPREFQNNNNNHNNNKKIRRTIMNSVENNYHVFTRIGCFFLCASVSRIFAASLVYWHSTGWWTRFKTHYKLQCLNTHTHNTCTRSASGFSFLAVVPATTLMTTTHCLHEVPLIFSTAYEVCCKTGSGEHTL